MIDDQDKAEIEQAGAGLVILYVFVTVIVMAAIYLSIKRFMTNFS